MRKEMTTDGYINLPNQPTRTANYHRQTKLTIQELDFDLDHDHIGDDIKMDGSRHIVFGTTNHIERRSCYVGHSKYLRP